MLLDLDHFKQINDAFGHPVGDAEALAERIVRATRSTRLPGPAAEHRLTVSIGAVEAEDDNGFDRLYSRVDQRLYRAKTDGRDRIVS